MANDKYKLGWGEESKIASAIKNGLLDGGDLVLTKDTKRLAFVDPNEKIIHFIKSRLITFSSLEDAKDYAAVGKSAYAGELISVLIDGKQKTYRLQATDSGFALENIESGLTGLKQYVQVVTEFPDVDQEEGVIYISDSTGKIWTGSEWHTVFEDISIIKSELDKKAPLENPEFTGLVKVDGEEIALKSYVEKLVSNTMSLAPGKVDEENPLPSEDYKAGATWRVVVDGTYAGQICEPGDLIICVNDYVDAYSDDDFIVVQGNITGAVTGADSSTDGEIVVFSGLSGKTIKNSGINIDALTNIIKESHKHGNKQILDSFTMTEEDLLQASENSITTAYNKICDRLIHAEPVVEEEYLYANGHGLVIEAVDENTNKAIYYFDNQRKELTFNTGSTIIGGAKNDNCHSSSIVMNSGNVAIIYGGSRGDGDVAEANIVINGGTLEVIYGGGMSDIKDIGRANHVGHAKIVVNNIEGTPQIFGGSYSYASVGTTEIIINKGDFSYITAGGSNGYTANSSIEINGGTVECVQSVNKGIVGRAKITINSGEITAMYAGAEPGGETTGSFGHTEFHLLGGAIYKLAKGLNNSFDYNAEDYVSGEYRSSVVSAEEADAFGLTITSNVMPSDVETAKTDAIKEAKNYVDSFLTLVEF